MYTNKLKYTRVKKKKKIFKQYEFKKKEKNHDESHLLTTVIGVQKRTVLDGMRAVTGAVAVFAPERPEFGASSADGVSDQVAAVHLGRLVVFVTERAVVFH